MTASASLNFSAATRDGVLIVELRGAIDGPMVLDGVGEQALLNTAENVVVVIGEVDYINSAGFSALIGLAESITQHQKHIYLVGLQSKVHVVFNSIGAQSLFNILPGVDEALERIRAAKTPPAGNEAKS